MMLSDVCLTSVCLSVAYIGPKSRTERPRQNKIGAEVAHITRDSDTTFKVKRSRSPGRLVHHSVGASGGCSDGRETLWPWETAATLPSVRRRKALRRLRGEERAGAYRGGRPPTASLLLYCWSVPARCRPGTKRPMNE